MRTEGDYIKINEWLLPLSWLYGIGVRLRNQIFEMGILKEQTYDIPIISVGNMTVGGTGKTPHVEYLVRLLGDRMKVGVLSRGYKRKSKGYVLAREDSTMQAIGDEPFQMKSKFPNIFVAVDANRRRGIENLTSDTETKDVDVIILDDAYQHRYVKPGINILLVDYHRFIMNDQLLPAGRLREPLSGKNRADVVIVTKCPKDLKPMEFRVLTKNLDLYPFQSLFFTTIKYGSLQPIFGGPTRTLHTIKKTNVLLVTGIASPKQMYEDLKHHCQQIHPLKFADHHLFTRKDIDKLNAQFEAIKSPKIVITTEKDATRLIAVEGLSDQVKDAIYSLPIQISFLQNDEETFNHKIISYVRKNSRNSILVERKDDNKSKDSNHPGNRTRTISFRDNR